MPVLRRLNDLLQKTATAIVATLMAAITVIIFAQVFGRYVLFYSLPWSEEMARYMMVWISALGAAVALRKGAHVGLDILVQRLPSPARMVVELLALLFALALTGVLAWFGFKLASFNMMQQSAAMRLPMGYPYAAVPTAAVLMVLILVEKIGEKLGGSKS